MIYLGGGGAAGGRGEPVAWINSPNKLFWGRLSQWKFCSDKFIGRISQVGEHFFDYWYHKIYTRKSSLGRKKYTVKSNLGEKDM